MDTRENITRELLDGAVPAQLARKYPRKSVYRIYNELVQSDQISDDRVIHAEGLGSGGSPGYPFEPAPPAPTRQTQAVEKEPEEVSPGKTGAEVIDFTGPKGLPAEAVNRIRGVLGISLRPKVLSMPTPELLYPAMIISVTELGFPTMRPDDFIDTVLYQWLEACDIIPYAFIKKSELEELAKTYGKTEEIIKDEKFRREHGLVTTDEVREAVLAPLVAKTNEMEKEISGSAEEQEDVGEVEDVNPEPEPAQEEEQVHEVNQPEPEPRKPTVGDLFGLLHISNIQKEVSKNDSAG